MRPYNLIFIVLLLLSCKDDEQTAARPVQRGIEETILPLALQNATAALHAERYYTTGMVSDAESWNIRDRHMVETINELREFMVIMPRLSYGRIIRTWATPVPQIWKMME